MLFPDTWNWDFGDGNTSTQSNPSHRYEDSGTYEVQLTVANDYGSDEFTFEIDVEVFNPEVSMPDTIIAGETANFSGLQQAGFIYMWNLGDGTEENVANFTHLYEFDQDTIITATVSVINLNISTNCIVSFENDIHYFLEEPMDTIDGIAELGIDLKFYPNPTTGIVTIDFDEMTNHKWIVSIINPQGKIFYREQVKALSANDELNVDLSAYPNGLYNIVLYSEEGYLSRKIVLDR